MFKKLIKNLYILKESLKNPQEKQRLFEKAVSSKYLLGYLIFSNIFGFIFFFPKINNNNYDLSYTRYISRKIGKLMDITIPEFLRSPIYNLYIKFFGVDINDLEETDLKKYKNIQEFFIRKVKVKYIDLTLSWKVDPLKTKLLIF
jgi:hypothetical protein